MNPDNANRIVPNDDTLPVPDTVQVDPRASFAAAVGDALNSIFQAVAPPGNPPIINRPDAPAEPLPKSAKWEPASELEDRALNEPNAARKVRTLNYAVTECTAVQVVELATRRLKFGEDVTVARMRAEIRAEVMRETSLGSVLAHSLPKVDLNELDLQAARSTLWRVADALSNGGPTNAHAINQAWEHLMPWLRVNPEG